jgi:hypothetical protein
LLGGLAWAASGRGDEVDCRGWPFINPIAALEGEVGVAGEFAPDRSGGLIVNCLGEPYGTLFQLRHLQTRTSPLVQPLWLVSGRSEFGRGNSRDDRIFLSA